MHIKTVDFFSENAPKDFTESIHETGFAILSNHTVDQSLVSDVLNEWKEYFAQETDVKLKDLPEKGRQDGYFPFKIEKAKDNPYSNLMEYFHYYKHRGLPEGLSNKTEKLYSMMESVALKLAEWLDDNTPTDIRAQFETSIPEMLKDSSNSVMRIIHYPPLDGSEDPGEVRAAEHEDICMITLICGATSKGLQVKDKAGNWHELTPSADQIAVNAGDMLQQLTNGFYKSTTHRVVNPEGEDFSQPRYSLPFFFHPWPEAKIGDGMTAKEFLRQRLIDNKVFDEDAELEL